MSQYPYGHGPAGNPYQQGGSNQPYGSGGQGSSANPYGGAAPRTPQRQTGHKRLVSQTAEQSQDKRREIYDSPTGGTPTRTPISRLPMRGASGTPGSGDIFGDSPAGTPGKGKQRATPWNKKGEKSSEAVKRLMAAGKAFSEANELAGDVTDEERDEIQDDWVETIAQYIVREPAFHLLMNNPPMIETVFVTRKFLFSIHLHKRWILFNTAEKWSDRWYANRRLDILRRAYEIYDEVIGISQSTILRTKIAPPEHNLSTHRLRKAMFQYHGNRGKIVTSIKTAIDLEHQLMRKLTMREHLTDTNEQRRQFQQSLRELQQVEECKEELRAKLKASKTDTTGKRLIDGLLQRMSTPMVEDLSFLPDNNSDDIKTGAEPDVTEPPVDHDRILRKLNEKSIDPKRFYDKEKRGASDIFIVKTPYKWPSIETEDQDQTEKIAGFTRQRSHDLLDSDVEEALRGALAEVDMDRFALNMKTFVTIRRRPKEVAAAKATSGTIFKNPAQRELVLFDNIFHLRAFLDIIRRGNQLLVDQELKQSLWRLWAVIALMYGCVAEGSLLLTVMDSVLEDVAEKVLGNLDPKHSTNTMMNLMDLRQHWQIERVQGKVLTDDDIQRLDRQETSRMVFNEFARFYRGANVLAYASVSWGTRVTATKSSIAWYRQLLRYSRECPGESCIENLKIFDNNDTRNNRWGLSVGVKDARKGFPENRCEISINRSYAYGCLYELIHWTRWHEGYSVFFHYFGELYHTACKPTRGKQDLVASVLRVNEAQYSRIR